MKTEDYEGKTVEELKKEYGDDVAFVDMRGNKTEPLSKDKANMVEIMIGPDYEVEIKCEHEFIPKHVVETITTQALRNVVSEILEKELTERKEMNAKIKEIKKQIESGLYPNAPSHNAWMFVCIVESIIFILVLLKLKGVL